MRAMSATYTTAHGNAWSLTHWVRPGIEPQPRGYQLDLFLLYHNGNSLSHFFFFTMWLFVFLLLSLENTRHSLETDLLSIMCLANFSISLVCPFILLWVKLIWFDLICKNGLPDERILLWGRIREKILGLRIFSKFILFSLLLLLQNF